MVQSENERVIRTLQETSFLRVKSASSPSTLEIMGEKKL
jgi:hypothetical protein